MSLFSDSVYPLLLNSRLFENGYYSSPQQFGVVPFNAPTMIATAQPVAFAPLIRFLEEHSVGVTEACVIRPSLEDVFVEITGIELERMKKEEEKGGRRS